MEIRGVRESELAEAIALQCLVFRPDGHERYWQYVRGDSSYRYDQSRVVVVDGRVVAHLRVWERSRRIGSCIVRMGGIGGVCTHPDYRGDGYATALMQDTISYMRRVGYDLSVLFSIIPCRFYRQLGWGCLPLEGFRITPRARTESEGTEWQVEPFNEARDLDEAVPLYDAHNVQQSGTLVRPRSYWDTAPARIRGILPTVVARHGDTLGGYLNFRMDGKQANVREVAYDRTDPTILVALVNHLLRVCEREGVDEIHGEIPHRHPIVDLLVEGCAGDLSLAGNTSMMLYAVNLPVLLRQLLPDLQSRLDASNQKFGSISICFAVNDEQCVLRLHQSGELQIVNVDTDAGRSVNGIFNLTLPAQFFWCALLGESSWRQLEPTLEMRDISTPPEISALLPILFPQQEVIFWGPNHY